MKPRLRLIKILLVLCIVCEVSMAIALVGAAMVAPFAGVLVRYGQANVGLYAGHGSLNWSFQVRLPFGPDSSVSYGASESGIRATGGERAAKPGYGRMSFGPFRLHMDNAGVPAGAGDINDPTVVVDRIEGTMTLTRPEVAAQAIAAARWPFLVSALCTGGVGLAILELLRRMLRSATSQEVFTTANIRNVQAVGYLLMASSVLKLAAGAWLVARMTAFVTAHVDTGRMTLETFSQGDVSLATGLLIVALAEVFRQGLTLKEDSQLTI